MGSKNGNGTRYDIEAIGRDYRAGVLSIREVARQHKIDHSYLLRIAKKDGWKRDLTQRIKEEVTRKLVTGDVTTPNVTDDEIVDTESKKVVQVLTLHRKDVQKSQGLVSLFQDQLNDAAINRDKIKDEIIDDTKGPEDGKPDLKRRGQMLRAVSLPAHAGVLRDLSVAQKNLIGLERQAYNMGDKGGGEGDEPPSIPIEFLPSPKRETEE